LLKVNYNIKKLDLVGYTKFDLVGYTFFHEKIHIMLQSIQMQLGMILALSTKDKDTLLILLHRHYSVKPALYLLRPFGPSFFSSFKEEIF